jgi:hypothetical protein
MNTSAAALLLASALAQVPEKGTATAPGEQQSPAAPAAQTPRDKALAQAADQAKKDVDFAAIHLHAAKLYLTGLYGLDGRPSTWDREHGVALFTHAQDALTDAQRQLAELQGFAQTTWPESRAPLSRVRTTLDGVEKRLRSLSVPLHPSTGGQDAGQSAIKDMYDAIDSAQDDLDKAAKAMGVDAKLRRP